MGDILSLSVEKDVYCVVYGPKSGDAVRTKGTVGKMSFWHLVVVTSSTSSTVVKLSISTVGSSSNGGVAAQ